VTYRGLDKDPPHRRSTAPAIPAWARGKPVDKRADIRAFGCVVYEMLTGRMAFDGETMSDTIAAILRVTVSRLNDARRWQPGAGRWSWDRASCKAGGHPWSLVWKSRSGLTNTHEVGFALSRRSRSPVPMQLYLDCSADLPATLSRRAQTLKTVRVRL
jgi:serine/threonine protein kinase